MKKVSSLNSLHEDIKKRIDNLTNYSITSYELLVDEMAFLLHCVQKCEKFSNDEKQFKEDIAHLKMSLDESVKVQKKIALQKRIEDKKEMLTLEKEL